MEDAKLKAILQQCSPKESPVQACLKAPPQQELEKLLGFSLDPEVHAKKAAAAAAAAAQQLAASAEETSHVEDTLTAAEIERLSAASEAASARPVEEGTAETAEPNVVPPVEAVAPAEPSQEEPLPYLEVPIFDSLAPLCETPVKPISKPPEVITISPGTPVEAELHLSSFRRHAFLITQIRSVPPCSI